MIMPMLLPRTPYFFQLSSTASNCAMPLPLKGKKMQRNIYGAVLTLPLFHSPSAFNSQSLRTTKSKSGKIFYSFIWTTNILLTLQIFTSIPCNSYLEPLNPIPAIKSKVDSTRNCSHQTMQWIIILHRSIQIVHSL